MSLPESAARADNGACARLADAARQYRMLVIPGGDDDELRSAAEELDYALSEYELAASGVEPDGSVKMSCAACGKPKPDDRAWARPAMRCECGGTLWTGTVTFRG